MPSWDEEIALFWTTADNARPDETLDAMRELVAQRLADSPPQNNPLEVPTIRTEHVTLRPWLLDDVDAVIDASSDPHIPNITTVPKDATQESASAFIERHAPSPALATHSLLKPTRSALVS